MDMDMDNDMEIDLEIGIGRVGAWSSDDNHFVRRLGVFQWGGTGLGH